MGNQVFLEQIVGPKISEAIASALGDNRPNEAVVKATVQEPVKELVNMLGGPSVAAWYKFFGNKDECVHLPDGTKYFIADMEYEENGTFGVQLRKRQY